MKRSSAPVRDVLAGGGGVKERIDRVEGHHADEIEMIQKEQRIASFWMIGMRATRRVRIASRRPGWRPSRARRSRSTT